MSGSEEFSADTARVAAERDDLGDWVADFLRSPGSDNAALAEQLSERLRCWLGPLRVPLDQLNRLAGPPGAPVVQEVDDDEWRDDVDDLSRRIREGLEPVPVIVSRSDDQLVLEDGNHRVEAIRRAGADEAWAVIGFTDPAERDRFVAELEDMPT
jgi:hypothetical protein